MLRFACITISMVLVFASGCSEQHADWSQAEKDNIGHFFVSGDANRAATAMSNNASTPFSESEYLKLQKLALAEAELVQDAVLAKAHVDLPKTFRDLYQLSIEQSIDAFENHNNDASLKASVLHDQWVDWFNANKRDIRIPR